jgi:glycosyltransferase involved in cell wall biosynthesis
MTASARPRVLYVQFTNPCGYSLLEHSARLLVDAGFDVAFLGVVAADDPLRFATDANLQLTLQPLPLPGWRQKLGYLRFAMAAFSWALRWKPSWIYASDRLAAPVALLLRHVVRTRVVYHEHDSPDEGAAPASMFLRAVMAARQRLARAADICVLPNAERAAAFARTTGRREVEAVWNCARRRDVTPPRALSTSGRLRVLYHGTIVPVRLPLAVIDAIAAVPGAVLSIVGYGTVGHPGYLDILKRRADALGVSDRVEFAGTFPQRRELMAHCATCDVGLALLSGVLSDFNERTMVGASSKVFEYLACGLALLVADLPDWRAAYVETGVARACDPVSAESVGAALRWFIEHPTEHLEMSRRARQRILDDWNYEHTFRPVLERMVASVGLGVPEAGPEALRHYTPV